MEEQEVFNMFREWTKKTLRAGERPVLKGLSIGKMLEMCPKSYMLSMEEFGIILRPDEKKTIRDTLDGDKGWKR